MFFTLCGILFLGTSWYWDQVGEVGHENIVLILLYLCCLDFLTHLVKMLCFFFSISDFVRLELEK